MFSSANLETRRDEVVDGEIERGTSQAFKGDLKTSLGAGRSAEQGYSNPRALAADARH